MLPTRLISEVLCSRLRIYVRACLCAAGLWWVRKRENTREKLSGIERNVILFLSDNVKKIARKLYLAVPRALHVSQQLHSFLGRAVLTSETAHKNHPVILFLLPSLYAVEGHHPGQYEISLTTTHKYNQPVNDRKPIVHVLITWQANDAHALILMIRRDLDADKRPYSVLVLIMTCVPVLTILFGAVIGYWPYSCLLLLFFACLPMWGLVVGNLWV